MPINQDQFLGSNANLCVTYPIKVNVAIVISNFHQKYVVVKAMSTLSKIHYERRKTEQVTLKANFIQF